MQPAGGELQELIRTEDQDVGEVDQEAISEAKISLCQILHNVGGNYNSDKFMNLIKTVSGREDGNFDGQIRFTMLTEELSPGQMPD